VAVLVESTVVVEGLEVLLILLLFQFLEARPIASELVLEVLLVTQKAQTQRVQEQQLR
jgi:hypothetical protein